MPPKSTTIAGPPKSLAAASALMMRSVPTSRGLSTRIGTPVRTPGSTTTCGISAKCRGEHLPPRMQDRRERSRRPISRSISVDSAPEQAAQQHGPFVGGPVLVGGDPPVRADLAVPDHPEHGVRVADIGCEQGHAPRHSSRRSMPRSKTLTEWVSAPTEMKSTPVSATSRARSMVSPPDASSVARPALIAHRLGHRRRTACCRAGSRCSRRRAARAAGRGRSPRPRPAGRGTAARTAW